ncbi:hypothetical protein [Azospirillum sp. TSH64]|uniref:hypothetical protein n=1 Tax=Azospirillum sp. TSH64 TaxID=652740 RepID=UPI0018EEC49F|nr:hypothetical protein [Azospirillum sp. TSH64]
MSYTNTYKVDGETLRLRVTVSQSRDAYAYALQVLVREGAKDKMERIRSWLEDNAPLSLVSCTLTSEGVWGTSDTFCMGYEFEVNFKHETDMVHFAIAVQGQNGILGNSLMSALHI